VRVTEGPEIAPDTTSTPGTSEVRAERGVLSELVPGLTGTLKAVTGSGDASMITWDAQGPLTLTTGFPEGRPDQLSFDAGGGLFALTIQDSATRSGALLVGNGSDLTEMAFDVSSFAWHQTEPGTLAAVSRPFGSTRPDLLTVSFPGQSLADAVVTSVVSVGPQDIVLAHGSWGFLIRRPRAASNEIVLLDESGDVQWTRPAHWAYAAPTGDILLSFYSNEIRELHAIRPDTDPGDPGAWFELPALGVSGVAWSPNGREVAVVVNQGGEAGSRLDVYDKDGEVVGRVPLDWRVWDVEWSGDGRFIVMPGAGDGGQVVIFYDSLEDTTTPVPFDTAVQIAVVAG
jgi:hypothetical protein